MNDYTIPEECPHCGATLDIAQITRVLQEWPVYITGPDTAQFGEPEDQSETEETVAWECRRCRHELDPEIVAEIERRLI